MDKDVRNRIQRTTQNARTLLEREFAEQLEGTYDIRRDGSVSAEAGSHLTPREALTREKLVAAVTHHTAAGASPADAVAQYLRAAAFTALNRFAALKMLEARGLTQECVTRGEESSGFKEFSGLAHGLALLPDRGYRLYLESLFDEIGREIGVLFDRRDPAALLWPRRQALLELLELLNDPELRDVWREDETIGWIYQFFNSKDERELMRDVKRGGSGAPRNSHELAVRNQFFTPRYVVQFLVDNTLGRTWVEMQGEGSRLGALCEYLVWPADEPLGSRPRKDPRDLRILDPACGSGHFLLYAFDLLLVIYEEAWQDGDRAVVSELTGNTLTEDYPSLEDLRLAVPSLVVEHNLYGVDIDARCAQIAALALWLRAQRAHQGWDQPSVVRPQVQRTHIVVAEPIPGDDELFTGFSSALDPPLLATLFERFVREMSLAGELGVLLRAEGELEEQISEAREQFVAVGLEPSAIPGLESDRRSGRLDLSGIDDDGFFHEAEVRILEELRKFAASANGGAGIRQRLFADDAAQGVALIDLVRKRFDVVLMNPPFGACSVGSKKDFDKAYPRTKNDLYAAFVERGIELLHDGGLLGAITSRTGFFLSSFQKWREDVLLAEAPPVVFADLGYGVLDGAMVEVAAYCLEKR